MALVKYIKHDGSSYEIEVAAGTSVMQAAVDNMIDGIVGECGGSCSCATCHCEPRFNLPIGKLWRHCPGCIVCLLCNLATPALAQAQGTASACFY